MQKFLHILFFLQFAVCNLQFAIAQKEKNIWYFGHNAGIDFSSGSPVALTNGAMFTDEAAAVISDSTGNLLFYSDGITVWNSQHLLMENGDSLMGNTSTSQSLIVPKPGVEDSVLYVFYADAHENNFTNGLRYAVVDMKYNNGLGKVIEKNVLLHYPSTEKIIAVTHSNGYDFWIIAHELNSNKFLTYLLTCNGLDTSVLISIVGTTINSNNDALGCLKSSIDGKTLALAGETLLIELYDFDNVTGQIFNPLTIPLDISEGSGTHGITISPDNSKLYVSWSSIPYGKIYQFDLSAGTLQDIINSKTLIFSKPCSIVPPDTCIAFGGMQIATDNKIYVSHTTANMVPGDDKYLGVINNPDSAGLACNYVHHGFYMAGKKSYISIPNLIDTHFDYIHCPASIHEKDIDKAITVYPNPAHNYLYIQNIPDKTGEIFIYNILGDLIFSRIIDINNNQYKIDLSNISKGAYFIKIQTNSFYQVKKLIIN